MEKSILRGTGGFDKGRRMPCRAVVDFRIPLNVKVKAGVWTVWLPVQLSGAACDARIIPVSTYTVVAGIGDQAEVN